MRTRFSVKPLFLALVLSLATSPIIALSPAHADTIQLPANDPAMTKARQSAQDTFDRILAKTMSARGFTADGLTIKVAVLVPGVTVENIWVEKVRAHGDAWKGKLANQPVHFKGRLGGTIRFEKSQVTDWSYEYQGILFGEYSTRALLKHMSKAEAATIRPLLSKNPMPKGW